MVNEHAPTYSEHYSVSIKKGACSAYRRVGIGAVRGGEQGLMVRQVFSD